MHHLPGGEALLHNCNVSRPTLPPIAYHVLDEGQDLAAASILQNKQISAPEINENGLTFNCYSSLAIVSEAVPVTYIIRSPWALKALRHAPVKTFFDMVVHANTCDQPSFISMICASHIHNSVFQTYTFLGQSMKHNAFNTKYLMHLHLWESQPAFQALQSMRRWQSRTFYGRLMVSSSAQALEWMGKKVHWSSPMRQTQRALLLMLVMMSLCSQACWVWPKLPSMSKPFRRHSLILGTSPQSWVSGKST
jgi:hypothetical protein